MVQSDTILTDVVLSWNCWKKMETIFGRTLFKKTLEGL